MAPPLSDLDRATGQVSVPDSARDVTVVLDAGWSSLAAVHGAYMSAVAVRGAERVAPTRTVRTLTPGLRTGVIGPLPTGGVSSDLTTYVHQPDGTPAAESFLTRLTATD